MWGGLLTIPDIFALFPDDPIHIGGSAARSLSTARDIDLFFPTKEDLLACCKRLGITHNSWKDPRGHMISRANYQHPQLSKPVQLLWDSRGMPPHQYIERDGSVHNEGEFHCK